jgi:hypothetical protein
MKTSIVAFLLLAAVLVASGQNTTRVQAVTGSQVLDILVNHKGQNPTQDSDGDGIPDVVENQIGTDPTKIDSDGDGIPDAVEVAFGFDPKIPDSDKKTFYTPTELPVSTTYPEAEAYDISNNGWVTGYADSSAIRYEAAVRWNLNTGTTEFAVRSADDLEGWAINDSGTVVGYGDSGALYWLAGSAPRLLGRTSTQTDRSSDVNQANVVVGSMNIQFPGDTGAYKWTDAESSNAAAGFTALPLPLGFNRFAKAYAINDSNQAVGVAYNEGFFGVIWNGAAPSLMLSGPNDTGSPAFDDVQDINNAGQVLGVAQGQPAVWSKASGLRLLPLSSGASSFRAWKINAFGVVLGRIGNKQVLWRPNASGSWDIVEYLANVLDPAFVNGFWGYSLNDKGQIVGSFWNGTVYRPVVLTPIPLTLSLAVDANNDGRIDGADQTLIRRSFATTTVGDGEIVQKSLVFNATGADIENGTKYLFVNDDISNGAWDKGDPGKPDGFADDDDVQELNVKTDANFGAIWFDHPAIDHLSFYKSRACTAGDKLVFPWTLSSTNPFPSKIYVRAEGIAAQVEGDLALVFGKVDKSTVYDSTRIHLTIVSGLGDSKFFNACRDYILRNNSRFYTTEKKYGNEAMRTVVMLQEKTTMKALDGFYRNPSTDYIQKSVVNFPEQTVIINGMFEDNGPPPFTSDPKGQGYLISDGVFDSNYSTPRGPGFYYIAQSADGTFTFGKGEVPVQSGYKEAMGGLYKDYAGGDFKASTMAGQALAGDTKLIFVTVTNMDTSASGSGPGVQGFVSDATFAGARDIVLFDGSSSCALANSNPDGNLEVQFNGSKHWYAPAIPFPYHIHSFLMFRCQKPRN